MIKLSNNLFKYIGFFVLHGIRQHLLKGLLMNKAEFFTMFGKWQGITLDQARADRMARSGGIFETLYGIRTVLFQLDVSAYRPLDTPVSGSDGEAK